MQDNINYIRMGDDLLVRIERMNGGVAKVYFVNNQSVQQSIPAYVTMVDGAGVQLQPFMDFFFITWADSYTLLREGELFMKLSQQKQQTIMAPQDAASGIV